MSAAFLDLDSSASPATAPAPTFTSAVPFHWASQLRNGTEQGRKAYIEKTTKGSRCPGQPQ